MNDRRGTWPYSMPHLTSFLLALAALVCDRDPDPRSEADRRPLSDEDARATAASPRVSWQSRLQIATALEEWLKVERQEDEHWTLAFANLRAAFDREVDHHLDVRLYLYTHSQHAFDLYCRFMAEETRWSGTR